MWELSDIDRDGMLDRDEFAVVSMSWDFGSLMMSLKWMSCMLTFACMVSFITFIYNLNQVLVLN